MRHALALLVLVAPATLTADQVVLKGGGRISGIVLKKTTATVTVEVGPGRITIPIGRVERIVEGASPLAAFRARRQALAESDVQGWLELALWAQDSDLLTQARESFEHVLLLEPQNPSAHRALGNVLLDERWVTQEESYRARGYVHFEGSWVTPAERESTLRARAETAAAERSRAEAEARVREADARARAAEAEARRAEAAASTSAVPAYSPFGFGTALVGGSCCAPPRPCKPQTSPVAVAPRPLSPPPPPRDGPRTPRPARPREGPEH